MTIASVEFLAFALIIFTNVFNRIVALLTRRRPDGQACLPVVCGDEVCHEIRLRNTVEEAARRLNGH